MDTRFSAHNLHKKGVDSFLTLDPHLQYLQTLKYTFKSNLLNKLPISIPGVYTLGGGRQIGKTTFLKQWMAYLIEQHIEPQNVSFITGEIIDDHHSLIRIIQETIEKQQDSSTFSCIIVDEVTYIKGWDKAIKFLADSGLLQKVVLILSGSDLTFIKEARMRFPGRRGKSDTVDFHMYPLCFKEVVNLKYASLANLTEDQLVNELTLYSMHGGYLTAINEYAEKNTISSSTFMTYSDWIRGDSLKRGKSEHYLREILSALIKTYGTQVTWNSLTRHLSIDHPMTVQDYMSLLESMDAIYIQHALREDTLTAAPKKAKKLYFADPFIFHSIQYWLNPEATLFSPAQIPTLIETIVINHIKRLYPTYYIKAEGKVDIAYIVKNKFYPIEIKWTNQLRAKELKQISKYSNGLILSKTKADF